MIRIYLYSKASNVLYCWIDMKPKSVEAYLRGLPSTIRAEVVEP